MSNLVTVVLTSLDPMPEWLDAAIVSAQSADRILVHIDAGSKFPVYSPSIAVRGKAEIHHCARPMRNAEAINWLTKRVQSGWLSVMCDDDSYIVSALQKLLQQVREGQYEHADVICCPCLVNGQSLWGASGDVDLRALQEHNLVAASSLVRVEAFKAVGGYDNIPLCDWGLWLKLKARGFRFGGFPEPLYNFRHGHERSAARREVSERGGLAEAHRQVLQASQ